MGRVLELMPGYFDRAVQEPDKVMCEADELLAEVDFDTFVGIGMSGALIVPLLARAMAKHMFVIRKEKSGHSSLPAVGVLGNKWIFVDDLISTGGTYRRVHSTVTKVVDDHNYFVAPCGGTRYVGTYLYQYDCDGGERRSTWAPARGVGSRSGLSRMLRGVITPKAA